MSEGNKPVSLIELVYWVKKELLSEESRKNDPVPLFAIEEIVVEVNFVVEGTMEGGFSALKVVEASSAISEQRIQKATIKMMPILDREQIVAELVTADPTILDKVKSESIKAVLKGSHQALKVAPSRE